MTGRLIAVEGLDGTGKTTLSKRLAERLAARWDTTPSGELREVRQRIDDLWAADERTLFYVGSVYDCGRRALGEVPHRDVVVDRYWASTRAYAAVRGATLDLDALESRVVPADVTVFVTVPEDVRRGRLTVRGATAEDLWADQRTSPLIAEYDRALARDVNGTLLRVDGTGEVDEVVDRIVAALPARGRGGQLDLFAREAA